MPPKFYISLIIAAIYIAAHIWGAIDKAKKDRAKREAAELQRRNGESDPNGGSGVSTSAPPTVRAGKPVDDLASRRRQQLEELRQRRAGQAGGGRTGRSTTGATTGAATASRDKKIVELGQSARQVPRVGESAGAKAFDLEQLRKRNEADRARRERDLMLTKRRDEQRSKAMREVRTPAAMPSPVAVVPRGQMSPAGFAVAERVATAAGDAPTRAPVSTSKSRDAVADLVREAMRDRASLRRMIIMKEVLDPPLSMRDPRR